MPLTTPLYKRIFATMSVWKPSSLKHHIDGIIHLAAESHVDRSIEDPLSLQNERDGYFGVLLQAAREAWKDKYAGQTLLITSLPMRYMEL